jgi:hypothetical protein
MIRSVRFKLLTWASDNDEHTPLRFLSALRDFCGLYYLPSHYYLFLSFIQIAVTYQTLDSLQEHGIAANDIQKLNDAGYHTVESVSA